MLRIAWDQCDMSVYGFPKKIKYISGFSRSAPNEDLLDCLQDTYSPRITSLRSVPLKRTLLSLYPPVGYQSLPGAVKRTSEQGCEAERTGSRFGNMPSPSRDENGAASCMYFGKFWTNGYKSVSDEIIMHQFGWHSARLCVGRISCKIYMIRGFRTRRRIWYQYWLYCRLCFHLAYTGKVLLN
jgi:hypothetical protein